MKSTPILVAAAAAVALVSGAAQAATLDDVKSKGVLACGVSTGLLGAGCQQKLERH